MRIISCEEMSAVATNLCQILRCEQTFWFTEDFLVSKEEISRPKYKGWKQTPESNEKRRQAKLGKPHPHKGRPDKKITIYCTNCQTPKKLKPCDVKNNNFCNQICYCEYRKNGPRILPRIIQT